MNIAVINIKDLIKYACIIIFLIIIVASGMILLKEKEELETFDVLEKNSSSFLNYLKLELPFMANEEIAKESEGEVIERKYNILGIELEMFDNIKEWENIQVAEENTQEIKEEIPQEDKTIQQSDKIETKVILENNIEASYNYDEGGIKVKNQSSYNDIQELIINSNYELNNKDKVIIYHTHTCESYTSSEKYNYEMTGVYRTTDLNYTVARVGDELEECLKQYGKTVVHDKTYHDYPSYNGAYDRSHKTFSAILEQNPDAEIAIDLHRDAVGANTYGPKVQIGEDICAQLMFVIGTDGGGLTHPNWRQNFAFAVKVQRIANEMYPGLFRPIILRDSRYNQNMTTATTIIEVGATGNTLDECANSMKYLAKVFDEAMK